MNWIQCLTKAIQFIESNLTHEITVNDIDDKVVFTYEIII